MDQTCRDPDLTTPTGAKDIVLQVTNLSKRFPIRKGLFRREVATAKAVEHVDLLLHEGETLGIVGESGCGKSTLARLLLRLVEPSEGRIEFQMVKDKSLPGFARSDAMVDITGQSGSALRQLRGQAQMIFQDPYMSLNPRLKIGATINEALVLHTKLDSHARRVRIGELLRDVGLRPEMADRYPNEFSGGQRQRISIARALAVNPRVIVADEPVSALDVSVQAQVISLLLELQREYNLSYIFISHDLSVVKYISDRVTVMYLGEIVETGLTDDIFSRPRHPYTESLMYSIPQVGRKIDEAKVVSGELPSNINPPSGCKFHRRCKYAQDVCSRVEPPVWTGERGHTARCHFAQTLELSPAFSL